MDRLPLPLLLGAPASRRPDGLRASSWCQRLPTLCGPSFVLREIERGDASSLLAALSTAEVTRFISAPPSSVGEFRRFITRAITHRRAGRLVCFAIEPRTTNRAVGLFQIRALNPTFNEAEWGFALAADYWGTGMFVAAARLVVEFTFSTLGVRRLEARVAVRNGRGNGILRKLGAVQEGLLHGSLLSNGVHLDQVLWTILADNWSPDRLRLDLPDPTEH